MKPIFREPLVIILPEHHPLARRRALTVPALRDERLILFPRRFAPAYYDSLMAIFRDAGVTGPVPRRRD